MVSVLEIVILVVGIRFIFRYLDIWGKKHENKHFNYCPNPRVLGPYIGVLVFMPPICGLLMLAVTLAVCKAMAFWALLGHCFG